MHVPKEISKANISFVMSVCLSASVTATLNEQDFPLFSPWASQEILLFLLNVYSHYHVQYTCLLFYTAPDQSIPQTHM